MFDVMAKDVVSVCVRACVRACELTNVRVLFDYYINIHSICISFTSIIIIIIQNLHFGMINLQTYFFLLYVCACVFV